MGVAQSLLGTGGCPAGETPAAVPGLLAEEAFLQALCLERKRAERSGRPFLLMLVADAAEGEEDAAPVWGSPGWGPKLAAALAAVKRETDWQGWYQAGAILGVIFTEIADADRDALRAALEARLDASLGAWLPAEAVRRLRVSFHFFPEDWGNNAAHSGSHLVVYPDLTERKGVKNAARILKRAMDVTGGALALILFSPLLAAIAAAIKFTSQGPVLFRQERIGQFGQPFTFVKFRSMHVRNDTAIHREYVKRFIVGDLDAPEAGAEKTVYKIQRDPRVTPVGRFLRRTSLDELPQFWNVLRGEMSLVGPRPAIPYELENYQPWHRRRVLEVKPGITGLWQVLGRSRTAFDEMVRLDLKYITTWSLWLDIKILLRTPWAVFFGAGAY